MQFDITELDKTLLIQTLFAHANPLGMGKFEYSHQKSLGDNVDGLTAEECELILCVYDDRKSGITKVLDYHKGKPIKLFFERKPNGRVLVSTNGYDSRNGKYRFFEALLNIFSLDEILITKKGYGQFALADLQEHLIRPKAEEAVFKSILKHTMAKENKLGKYYAIDESQINYQTPFMP